MFPLDKAHIGDHRAQHDIMIHTSTVKASLPDVSPVIKHLVSPQNGKSYQADPNPGVDSDFCSCDLPFARAVSHTHEGLSRFLEPHKRASSRGVAWFVNDADNHPRHVPDAELLHSQHSVNLRRGYRKGTRVLGGFVFTLHRRFQNSGWACNDLNMIPVLQNASGHQDPCSSLW